MQLSDERATGRRGITAVQSFFEQNRCVFQEVAQQNDFGKDGYVDLGNEDGVVTCLCAALQVKAGMSYRTAKGDYFIPLDGHADTWRHSTVPIFGIVHDPEENALRWVDLTGHLRENPQQNTGTVPVPRESILDRHSLRQEFRSALAAYSADGLTLNLLTPGPRQVDAVFDAWALGRFDARFFLILRRLILELGQPALLRAIFLLSHAGLHPDIFWRPSNWVPQRVQDAVQPSFRWSPEEISEMLKAVDQEDWGRGTLGQSLDVLLYEDPKVVAKMELTIGMLLDENDELAAARAAILCLTHSKNQRKELELISEQYPALLDNEWFRDVAQTVKEFGSISLY
jgi:hypothetical protein